MIKKIYHATEYKGIDPLIPAKKFIPDWYKNIKSYNEKTIVFNKDDSMFKNIRNCMPFFDSLSSGYMIVLHTDIHVSIQKDGSRFIRWESQKTLGKLGEESEEYPVTARNPNDNPIPIPAGCASDHFAWLLPYYLKTDDGHSLFVSHPFNRFDLPFVTLTGIIDTDKSISRGNLPFFIRLDFEGVIPQGTPIAQILPFKRDSWQAINENSIIEEGELNRSKSRRKFFNFYKDNMWFKKEFN